MNILLIHSDQHRYDCVGSSGLRPDIETPSLDRLAAEGISFSHAFSTIPICTPARASLLTGAWPTTHGSFCIPTGEVDRSARCQLPILTRLLADNGYRIAWTGKYHEELEERPNAGHGIEEYVSAWNYHRYRESLGLPPSPAKCGLFGEEDTGCPPEHSSLAWQADNVMRQIDERRETPFFIRWDPPEPHLPCKPTSPFASRFADADIAPWSSFPDLLAGKPAAQRRQLRIWGIEGWSWERWMRVVRLYYGVIAEMDYQIGRVLAHLDKLGIADDTLVIYSTDHGDFCGGHGQMDKHFNMYEDVVRVPLVVRWPGKVPAGQICDAFVSNSIDIARTVLEAAGICAPETFVGSDLVRLACDPAAPRREYAFSQYFGTESGAYSMRMLRGPRYKFVYHPVGDLHEFYDLEEDPGELLNRIDDPRLAPEIQKMKFALWETMKANGDRLANLWTRTELQGYPSLAEEFNL